MQIGMIRKRNMVRAFLIVGLLCVAMLISGCEGLYTAMGLEEKMPLHQLGTTWRSEDGKIEFTIVEVEIPEHEEKHGENVFLVKSHSLTLGHGFMLLPDRERIQICYFDGLRGYVEIDRMVDDPIDPSGEALEKWYATDVHDGYFVATVEQSTIYTPGDRIRFDRVEP